MWVIVSVTLTRTIFSVQSTVKLASFASTISVSVSYLIRKKRFHVPVCRLSIATVLAQKLILWNSFQIIPLDHRGGSDTPTSDERRSSLRREREKETTHNGNGNTGNSITNITPTKNGRLTNNSACLSNVIFPLLSDVSEHLFRTESDRHY